MRVGKFSNFIAMRIVHIVMASGPFVITMNWLIKSSDIIVVLFSPLISVIVLFTTIYLLEIMYLTMMLLRSRVAIKTDDTINTKD